MFDPSKIDLDLDNNAKKDTENIIQPEPIKSEEKTDVLSDIQKVEDKIFENKDISPIENKEEEDKEEEDKEEEDKIIFDININSIESLIKYLVSEKYDFFILEPEEDKVKISFKKDNLEKEVKYIKYPVYLNILLKAKSITKLKIEDTINSQEGV
jgi:type II secretory ATPase GspE/PulE/Tfp pilus assembly ATPase PilB-like protein